MMKVALLLSGLFRNNNSKDYLIDKIISKYPTDVYCQCWYTSEQNKQESEAKIIEAYSPKKLLMEKHIADYAELIKLHGYNLATMGGRTTHNQMHFSQLHGLSNVSSLFDWSQYDFIVRARYDSCHLQAFPDLTTLKKDTFYTNCSYNTFVGNPYFFIDVCFILPNTFNNFFDFSKLYDAEFCKSMYSWKENWAGWNFFPELFFSYYFEHYKCWDKFVKMEQHEFCAIAQNYPASRQCDMFPFAN